MILIGLGSNLESADGHSTVQNLKNALAALATYNIQILRSSRFYETAPVPADDAPWYVNAVAEVSTELSARDLLRGLLAIETQLGRIRGMQNAPRIIDLDLLDFHGSITTQKNLDFTPRQNDRGHSSSGHLMILPRPGVTPCQAESVTSLLNEIKANQIVRPLTS